MSAEQYESLLPLATAERLGSYSRATEADITATFGLYEWNMRAAASVMELTFPARPQGYSARERSSDTSGTPI
ncbi:hypothetical protein [Microbacterium esteraromaticum]|uniref:hypothetical protein n=1 Tax=Microbacterium esteraromaticum TaxID=57043 RepID=UPI001C9467B8|nr:hypothetical protein [Microbacterium esteraromaticum]MBY6059876.1 hypothetical protein [Microbacterium esteraromaticum]